jgi:hypothetical protein
MAKVTTIAKVTADELTACNIAGMRTDETLSVHVTYTLKDDQGAAVAPMKSMFVPLTPAEENQLNGFINATVLKAINAAEGTEGAPAR